MAVSKRNRYRMRVQNNGGRDRYGRFRDGKQISPDSIAGHNFWIPFSHLQGK